MNFRIAQPFATSLILAVLFISAAFGDSAVIQNAVPEPTGKYFKLLIFTKLVRPLRPQQNEREVDVYLPVAYINDAQKLMRFPVIYLLHGSPGKPDDFEKNGHWPDFLEQNVDKTALGPAILVAPDGNFLGAEFGDSEWLNSADGEDRYEDFVVDEVVPYIDAHFRTLATARGRVICGVSEGGFGAVNIAMHRPTMFSTVLACSGYYVNDGSGWARKIMGHDQAFLSYNSPLTYVDDPQTEAKYLMLWQSQHYFIGSGIDEKRYTVESAEMANRLAVHKVPVVLFQADGKHGWGLWNTLFVEGLKDLFPLPRMNELSTTAPAQPAP